MTQAGTDNLEPGPVGLENQQDFEASVAGAPSAETALTLDTALQVGGAAAATVPLEESLPLLAPAPSRPGAPEQPAGRPAWVGRILGHFKLLRALGEGSMGLVIQAQDIHLGRIVALKILRKRIRGMREEDRVRQFLREARAAASIEHPNVVPVYEINSHEGWWYIAMEMLEGGTLQTVVKAAGPLRPERACPIIADAATGLAAAHQAGIVHRDVKPGNLMLARTGRCKVTDFGLVHLDDPNDPFELANRGIGTPYYMAPEVARHRPHSPAVDVYGLGGALYYALTGEPPFTGANNQEVIRRNLNDPPPDVREKAPDCPASLAALITRALSKNPADRPGAAEFALALRAESVGSSAVEGHPLGSGSWAVLSGGPGTSAGRSGLGTRTTGTQLSDPAGGSTLLSPLRMPMWARGALAASVLMLIVAAFVIGRAWSPAADGPTEPQPTEYTDAQSPAVLTRLGERFPRAPQEYGVLGPNAVSFQSDPRLEPSPFSWVARKVELPGARFVASRGGRHYWPIDAPAAALIRAELVVGYPTAQAAQADGKIPAP